jgi:glutathione synthase/RimK-type ligase-like ATP-grasp enzyme
MRVLLVGPPEREELARLELRLEERGAGALACDPRRAELRLDAHGEWLDGADLERVGAVYVADLGLPATGDADGSFSESALRASQTHLVLWETLLERLARRVRVVNLPRTWDLHGLKPYESRAYAAADLPAPRTLATTDARELATLGAARDGWITKGLVGGYGFTQAFEPDAAAQPRGARLVQERVAGENVRAYVAGGRVVGAGSVVSADAHDSRRATRRVRRFALPAPAEQAALRAVALWGMDFAAVDLMLDRDDRWWLLECNSAPFFVEFERLTGVPVSGALADLLVERRRR